MKSILYALVIILGIGISLTLEQNVTPTVNANVTEKQFELPRLNPKWFDMKLDLNKGTAEILSGEHFARVDVDVRQPAKVVEKIVPSEPIVKTIVKKETEVIEKVVLFNIPAPALEIPTAKKGTILSRK